MTKQDVVDAIVKQTKATKKDVNIFLDAFMDTVKKTLKSGDKLTLTGFGTFEVKATAEREGRNPKTGETIKIAASKKPVFSASKVLKDEVND